jgi:hypothetical protein
VGHMNLPSNCMRRLREESNARIIIVIIIIGSWNVPKYSLSHRECHSMD